MFYIMGLNIFVIQLIYFDNKKSERPIILPKEKFEDRSNLLGKNKLGQLLLFEKY